MLETFSVAPREGRVRFLTEGQTRWVVTVECAMLNQAYNFEIEPGSKLKIGDFVRISGLVRINPTLKQNGEPAEANLQYWHEPYDGSEKKNWVRFELLAPKWERIPPPDVADTLRDVLEATKALLENWDGVSPDRLQQTIEAWDQAANFMRPILEQRIVEEFERTAPVKALELDF